MSETMYDADKLTQQERSDANIPLVDFERHNATCRHKCTQCKKDAPSPTTRYTVKGIEIIEKGESLCSRCLTNRKKTYEQIFNILKKEKS